MNSSGHYIAIGDRSFQNLLQAGLGRLICEQKIASRHANARPSRLTKLPSNRQLEIGLN
jgi:hypothetical protein